MARKNLPDMTGRTVHIWDNDGHVMLTAVVERPKSQAGRFITIELPTGDLWRARDKIGEAIRREHEDRLALGWGT